MRNKQQDMPSLYPSNVEGDKGVIKYVRKDVFIEKAAEWLASNVTCDGYTFQSKAKMIREFRKAMEL